MGWGCFPVVPAGFFMCVRLKAYVLKASKACKAFTLLIVCGCINLKACFVSSIVSHLRVCTWLSLCYERVISPTWNKYGKKISGAWCVYFTLGNPSPYFIGCYAVGYVVYYVAGLAGCFVVLLLFWFVVYCCVGLCGVTFSGLLLVRVSCCSFFLLDC